MSRANRRTSLSSGSGRQASQATEDSAQAPRPTTSSTSTSVSGHGQLSARVSAAVNRLTTERRSRNHGDRDRATLPESETRGAASAGSVGGRTTTTASYRRARASTSAASRSPSTSERRVTATSDRRRTGNISSRPALPAIDRPGASSQSVSGGNDSSATSRRSLRSSVSAAAPGAENSGSSAKATRARSPLRRFCTEQRSSASSSRRNKEHEQVAQVPEVSGTTTAVPEEEQGPSSSGDNSSETACTSDGKDDVVNKPEKEGAAAVWEPSSSGRRHNGKSNPGSNGGSSSISPSKSSAQRWKGMRESRDLTSRPWECKRYMSKKPDSNYSWMVSNMRNVHADGYFLRESSSGTTKISPKQVLVTAKFTEEAYASLLQQNPAMVGFHGQVGMFDAYDMTLLWHWGIKRRAERCHEGLLYNARRHQCEFKIRRVTSGKYTVHKCAPGPHGVDTKPTAENLVYGIEACKEKGAPESRWNVVQYKSFVTNLQDQADDLSNNANSSGTESSAVTTQELQPPVVIASLKSHYRPDSSSAENSEEAVSPKNFVSGYDLQLKKPGVDFSCLFSLVAAFREIYILNNVLISEGEVPGLPQVVRYASNDCPLLRARNNNALPQPFVGVSDHFMTNAEIQSAALTQNLNAWVAAELTYGHDQDAAVLRDGSVIRDRTSLNNANDQNVLYAPEELSAEIVTASLAEIRELREIEAAEATAGRETNVARRSDLAAEIAALVQTQNAGAVERLRERAAALRETTAGRVPLALRSSSDSSRTIRPEESEDEGDYADANREPLGLPGSVYTELPTGEEQVFDSCVHESAISTAEVPEEDGEEAPEQTPRPTVGTSYTPVGFGDEVVASYADSTTEIVSLEDAVPTKSQLLNNRRSSRSASTVDSTANDGPSERDRSSASVVSLDPHTQAEESGRASQMIPELPACDRLPRVSSSTSRTSLADNEEFPALRRVSSRYLLRNAGRRRSSRVTTAPPTELLEEVPEETGSPVLSSAGSPIVLPFRESSFVLGPDVSGSAVVSSSSTLTRATSAVRDSRENSQFRTARRESDANDRIARLLEVNGIRRSRGSPHVMRVSDHLLE